MSEAPRFFHISPDQCGAEDLAKLFQANGLAAAYYERGRLGEELAWADITGEIPFAKWPDVQLFAGLYRYKPIWRPPLDGWRSFKTLDRFFPNSYFILTTRDVDTWLFDRLTANNGRTASNHMLHLGVDEIGLAEIWARDWESHIDEVTRYFGDDPRLIQVDMETESPLMLGERLAGLLKLKSISGPIDWSDEAEILPEAQLLQILDQDDEPADQIDDEFVADIVGYCLRGIDPQPEIDFAGLSRTLCVWDGESDFAETKGGSKPIKIVRPNGRGPDYAISAPGDFNKLHRAEGVINDILRLGRRASVAIDMQDARWLGTKYDKQPNNPVLAYNRREMVKNVMLWPLPEIHGPENFGFTMKTTDIIPFEKKHDEIVWRGTLSGYEALGGDERGVGALSSLRQLEDAGDDVDARERAWQNLCRTSRMSVLRRWFGKPGFDLAIVMAWNFRRFVEDPLLAPYCDTRRNLPFFHKYRYQLSLAGHDTGSNFIPMINSQSVLFKEEDGWEVYYSGRFKPWEHYIPLKRNCGDLPEKLEWARGHPEECMEMSRLARAEVARFANPINHRKIKEGILDGLAAAGMKNT